MIMGNAGDSQMPPPLAPDFPSSAAARDKRSIVVKNKVEWGSNSKAETLAVSLAQNAQ